MYTSVCLAAAADDNDDDDAYRSSLKRPTSLYNKEF